MVSMMQDNDIKIFPNEDDLCQFSALDFSRRAQEAVRLKGFFSVVLSGGNTPKLFFDALSHSDYCIKNTPWEHIRFFFGDERYLPSDDINSNYHTANAYLFSKVPVNRNNIYRIPTEFDDPKDAAIAYEKTLRQVFQMKDQGMPSFDLIYLGLGDNSHTASLMPFSDIVKYYTENPLSKTSHRLVDTLFVPETNMHRITLTPNAINNSQAIIFMVAGVKKAAAVWNVLAGDRDPLNYPSQLIHGLHEKTTWYLDKLAAEQLNYKTTLAIDIGGTSIKMMVLDSNGNPLTEYIHEPTPHPATPDAVGRLIDRMIQGLTVKFDRISAGFPGVIHQGVVMTAPNMNPAWVGFSFEAELARMTNLPTRVANDADIQGLGDISGEGVELVITLGTGIGSALFINGQLVPNLELGHHPFCDNLTYEDCLGKAALERDGATQWSENLKKAIALWQKIFNYDRLYLGGGNAHQIHFDLPESIKVSDNMEGVLGGIKLWEQ